MIDTAKPTPGPYSVHHTTGYGLTLRSDSKKCRFVRTPSGSIAHYTIPAEEAQANMELVYEAFETHHETNLTPRQLLEQYNDLYQAALFLCADLLDRHQEGGEAWDKMQDFFTKAALTKHGEESQ